LFSWRAADIFCKDYNDGKDDHERALFRNRMKAGMERDATVSLDVIEQVYSYYFQVESLYMYTKIIYAR